MKLQKTVIIQEGYEKELSAHYEAPRDKEKLLKIPRSDVLCTPMRICYFFVILLLAVPAPVLFFFAVFSSNPELKPEPWTCSIKAEYRVPCLTDAIPMVEETCLQINCCWNETDSACFHSIPSQHSYSAKDWRGNEWAVSQLETEYLNLTSRLQTSPYRKSVVGLLQTSFVATSEDHLRFYLYDPETGKPEVTNRIQLSSSKFRVEAYGPEYFSLEIYRRENTRSLLFSTSRGPTIASENYWELSLQFPKEAALFGLGSLRLSSKPKLLYNTGQRLGANPFIIILDAEGSAYGVLFSNPGPLEFQLLENSNLLLVKSLSTVMWDISVFAGPTPADVMEQYTSIEGRRPILPPPWALGFHVCRNTSKDNDTLYFMEEATELLYESDCLQEELLYQFDFNMSEIMGGVAEKFRETGRKLLLSLPPQVNSILVPCEPFVLVEDKDEPLQEEYNGLNVSYPDFFNEGIGTCFAEHLTNLTTNIDDMLGGFVLQDNWPAVNTSHNIREDMVYVPEGTLSRGTLWWLARHGNTFHYNLHNMYGLQHAKLVASNLQADKHIVLSAATYTGSGAVGGSHAHARADVTCTWSNMKTALETALGLGLAGIPLAGGGSVCGTMGDYDEEVCTRWYLMSSMLPLMRVSSELPLRDPLHLKSGNSREAVKRYLDLRYSLLAYFYSLFHEASSTGVPVARPMFFDFPVDEETWTKYEQFMIGPALLARPAFHEMAVSVPVYLPAENVSWYLFEGGHEVNSGIGGVTIDVTNLSNELVLLLRGGYIVPTQKAQPTVEATLTGPYSLVVGLNCREGGACNAAGDLYVNSNITFNFQANNSGLDFQSNCTNPSSSILQNISVYGLNVTACLWISVGPNTEASCTVTEENQVLEITNLELDLCNATSGRIQWEVINITETTTTITTSTSVTSAPTIEIETTTKSEGTAKPETTTETETTTKSEGTTESKTTTETETTTKSEGTTEPKTTTETETTTKSEGTTESKTTTETETTTKSEGTTEPKTTTETETTTKSEGTTEPKTTTETETTTKSEGTTEPKTTTETETTTKSEGTTESKTTTETETTTKSEGTTEPKTTTETETTTKSEGTTEPKTTTETETTTKSDGTTEPKTTTETETTTKSETTETEKPQIEETLNLKLLNLRHPKLKKRQN